MSTSNQLKYGDLAAWLPSIVDHRFGVAKLSRPVSLDFYDQWLASGYNADMSYLERHREFKSDPVKWLPFARSALVFAIDYGAKAIEQTQIKNHYVTRTAMYTRYAPNQEDYHEAIRAELEPVLQELKVRYPNDQFRLAIDAEPVLERDLAVRAGLGWVGKNTCVIDRNGGSLFFIAEILMSLEVGETAAVIPDFCGTCTRCLDACPTQAFVAPRVLDAGKCISYWTIESRKVPPPDLREKFGDWFFGCDICQTVCPWNGKVFGRSEMNSEHSPAADRVELVRELSEILKSSGRELERRFSGTPLSRARGFGLKRNALVVIGNSRLHELASVVAEFEKTCDERLKQLSQDTLQLLSNNRP